MDHIRDTLFSMARRTSLTVLRQIPIVSVALALGIPLKKTGTGVWNVKSEDDPKGYTSLTLFENSNRWIRYSSDAKGSTIDLVIEWKQCSLETAIDFLTTHFPFHR